MFCNLLEKNINVLLVLHLILCEQSKLDAEAFLNVDFVKLCWFSYIKRTTQPLVTFNTLDFNNERF